VLSGHPWAFSGEIDPRHPAIADGESAELYDYNGRSLGSGIWSNLSQIAWRRYSHVARPFNAGFIGQMLRGAVGRRAEGRFRRLVWSEADHLPGLVVDQFDRVLVVQALTAGIERVLPEISGWLRENLGSEEIVFRNDAAARRHDALPLEVRTLSGAGVASGWFRIEGVEYFLNFVGGQKTGFYLDQREQHVRVASFARGRRVLDGFCNQGGFALQCARAGAAEVLGIDSSAECVEVASRNAARNALEARFLCANMFDWFTRNREPGRFGLIVLDPPPFARNKESVEGALRGYKELNLRALRLLAPGGVLATYSCSQRVGGPEFLAMLAEAASDAHRTTRLLEVAGQPVDHPVLLNFPESHYLKGAIMQVE
jgi:23S rRNA (cytosine1962-C5)-methyltransferase